MARVSERPALPGSGGIKRRLRLAPGLAVALGLLGVAGVALAQTPPAAPAEAQASFAYSRDPAKLVLSFDEVLGAIEDPDPGASLRVYGDGRVVVHYPDYMTRAGDYSFQLGRDEMEGLLRSLIDKEVVEFDEAATRRGVREAAAARRTDAGEFFAAFDAAATEIRLRLDRYTPPAGRGPERLGVEKRISWRGLRAQARHYPDVAAIQKLAAARRELVALMEREDLVKIE
jgi:hypothetical protein